MKINLNKAFDSLYNIIALDRTIRTAIFKELVKERDVCFLLSIGYNYPMANLKITRGGHTANLEYQLANFLVNPRDYWESLGLKEQVVLKEITNPNSTTFDRTIFLAEGVTYFTQAAIKEYFAGVTPSEFEEVHMIYTNSSKVYYKIVRESIIKNDLPKKYKGIFVDKNTSVVFNDGQIVATGDNLFGDYLLGKGRFGGCFGQVVVSKNIQESQYKLNKSKYEYAIAFTTNGVKILTKEKLKLTCDIIDLWIDDMYELIGVYITYNDSTYPIECHVPKEVYDGGLSRHQAVVSATELKNGSLKEVNFIEFKEKK